MILHLDNMPFTTAVSIIKYCYLRDIDTERSSVYYDRIHKKGLGTGDGEPWILDVPDHLLTYFRLKYGGLE